MIDKEYMEKMRNEFGGEMAYPINITPSWWNNRKFYGKIKDCGMAAHAIQHIQEACEPFGGVIELKINGNGIWVERSFPTQTSEEDTLNYVEAFRRDLIRSLEALLDRLIKVL